MTSSILSCDGLVKALGGRRVVDRVGFHVGAGEIYGLLGPNGAGKTTTISMICGLLTPDEGTSEVDGVLVSSQDPASRSSIGYVPQDLALYPDLTAAENLAFFGRLHGIQRQALPTRVNTVLHGVGLDDRRDDRVATFSGGMKRRLNIAVALLHEPRLLILDEPTVGVDPQSRNAILDSIEELAAGGTAVLYTTHYMEEAARLCHRVAIIDEGRIVAEGDRRELVQLIGDGDVIRLTSDRASVTAARAIAELEGVVTAVEAGGTVEVRVDDAGTRLVAVLAAATAVGMHIQGVAVTEPDLEAVFLHLTGKQLRD